MGNDIVIRDAKPSDLPQIAVIERLSFKEPYDYDLLSWLYTAPRYHFIVAEVNNRVVGYVIYRIEKVGVLGRSLQGHIVSIAVHPNWRRRGIGERLMREAIIRCKLLGCRRVVLEVRVSNKPAIRLYEKLGFRREKILRSYYSDGEDAWFYVLDLDDEQKR